MSEKQRKKSHTGKTVRIITLGCKVNQYESQALKEQFAACGHKITSQAPDLYIVNTCSVTAAADRKSRKIILQAKRKYPEAKIAACGCLAELNSGSLEKLGIDYIIPQGNKHNLVKIILSGKAGKHFSGGSIWDLKIKDSQLSRAFLKVQDGCNNFCTFCKIPYLRGRPASRKKNDIIEEVKRLSLKHEEIVLCGINLSLYGRDLNPAADLSGLCQEIINLQCLGRLRLSSLQPLYLDKKLIALSLHPKMAPHFHLSFQYGENRILAKMNKKETRQLYLKKVEAIRNINPRAAVSCDIMIGFPGETAETFRETTEFLKIVKPMRMHIFRFSPREKTPFAQNRPNSDSEIKKRYYILDRLAKEFARRYARSFIGQKLEIIADERKNGFTAGYTQNYIRVYLREKVKIGSRKKIIIKEISPDSKVFGRLAATA